MILWYDVLLTYGFVCIVSSKWVHFFLFLFNNKLKRWKGNLEWDVKVVKHF